MKKNKKQNQENQDNTEITELIKEITEYVPILTLISTILVSMMTSSKFIMIKLTLFKYNIYQSSFISINSSEIIANMFISIIVSFIFVYALIQIKKVKITIKNWRKILNIVIYLLIGNSILNYELFFLYDIDKIIILIILSVIISYYNLNKINIDNLVTDSIFIGITLLICISLFPIAMFVNNTNLNLAKYKENSFNEETPEKVIIYNNGEKSILCNYDSNNKDNKIDCSSYEIVNNTDILISSFED